ncbi:MAG: hypothetical protein NTY77_06355 [Elusimicrobia bacterium]|nr:hypothetical protein [Elusimicrobiota bacterium]
MDLAAIVSSMSMANIIGNLIFSGVGFVAFMYGKKQGHFKLMVLGGVLMVYPYFVPNTMLLYLIGAALSVATFYVRD